MPSTNRRDKVIQFVDKLLNDLVIMIMNMNTNNKLAPVLLFVFNRPLHTRKTLEALADNYLANESVLYIFADGPKDNMTKEDLGNVKQVRELIKARQWCQEVHIIEADRNKGLANSVIDGVTQIVNEHEKVIVLEDDLITSRGFLQFMNEALNKYVAEEKIMHVSGYQFPIDVPALGEAAFIPIIASWGWGTWKRAWTLFDPLSTGYEQLKHNKELTYNFDLGGTYPYSEMLIQQLEIHTIDSWAIRWWWSVFSNNGISLFPDSSLVKNIGFGKDATHTKGRNPFESFNFKLDYSIRSYPTKIEENKQITLALQKLYRSINPANISLTNKIWRWVVYTIKSLAR